MAKTATRDWHLFIPKLITALREGYDGRAFRADLFAGLTVAIVALPLSMALAIASGTSPERGLFTAVVAGFLIFALGGSDHQIGGLPGLLSWWCSMSSRNTDMTDSSSPP